MNITVTYTQLKNVGALAGVGVRYMDNGMQFRAIASISGHPQIYIYDSASAPATWAVDFPLATLVDAIDL